MAETGLRPGDLVKLTRNRVTTTDAGTRMIRLATSKSRGDRIVAIPLTAAAQTIIDGTPDDQLLILQTGQGKPWSEKWLSVSTRKHLRAIGLLHGEGDRLGLKRRGARKGSPECLTLYDLRGTALTRLMRANLTLTEAALHTGWKQEYAARMLDIYFSQDPDQADGIADKLKITRLRTEAAPNVNR